MLVSRVQRFLHFGYPNPFNGCLIKFYNTFIKKRFSAIFYCFVRICIQSFEKEQNKIYSKILYWFKNSLKKSFKIPHGKVISKNFTEICTFFIFTHVRQTCFAFNLFLVHFLRTFLTDFEISVKICVFDTYFNVLQNNFCCHVYPFLNFEAKPDRYGTTKSKNVFIKFALDFNFAFIKGPGFLTF